MNIQIANPTVKAEVLETLGLTVRDRTLVNKGSKRGLLATMHLEEVRDTLTQMAARQHSRDVTRSLNQLHVSFAEGVMKAQFIEAVGPDHPFMLVSETAAQQLAGEVIPANGFRYIRHLAESKDKGPNLATINWAHSSRNHVNPRMIRIIDTQVGNQVFTMVRSCHSPSYATYSNVQFVQDILDNAGEYVNLPVVQWSVSDTAMRLRFAGNEDGSEISVNKPIPMIECWNSEVGKRRVGLRGGMWKLVCTNGMGSWRNSSEFNWTHRGDNKRISDGVSGAFANLLNESRGVVNAYTRALDFAIDDAMLFLEKELIDIVPTAKIVNIQNALKHPTTTPGGNLASCVDAITLIAQDESNLFDQYEMERVASSMMARTLLLN